MAGCLSLGMAAGLIGGQNDNSERLSELPAGLDIRSDVRSRLYSGGVYYSQGALDEPQLATPTPTTVAPPAEALPVVTQDPNSIEGIICSFDWDCDYWIAVAFCESSLYPKAIGYGGTYVGLYQVWTGHGFDYGWLLDPYNNTLAAWELSDGGRKTSPWPACRWVSY